MVAIRKTASNFINYDKLYIDYKFNKKLKLNSPDLVDDDKLNYKLTSNIAINFSVDMKKTKNMFMVIDTFIHSFMIAKGAIFHNCEMRY